ncbi:MAG TPA: hypothetical protein VE549_01780 [Myxococcaceae bacterium]|nr:hypothetical protein [Myxococcaceae bacterium]
MCVTRRAGGGKRLYALELPHAQAGVAWTFYQLRRAALERRSRLSAEAMVLPGGVSARASGSCRG